MYLKQIWKAINVFKTLRKAINNLKQIWKAINVFKVRMDSRQKVFCGSNANGITWLLMPR
jgi:hypothetical protein